MATNTNEMELAQSNDITFKEETATRLNALALTMIFEGSDVKAQKLMEFTACQTHAKLCETSGQPRRRIPATLTPFELDDVIPTETSAFTVQSSFLFFQSIFSIEAHEPDEPDEQAEDQQDQEHTNNSSTEDSSTPVTDDDDSSMVEAEDSCLDYAEEDWVTNVTGTSWDFASLYALQLYNMAVFQHKTGLANGDLTAIGRAHSMYRAGVNAVTSQRKNLEATPGNLILMLALYSNLGHASCALQDYTTAEACRRGMEGALRGTETATGSNVDCKVAKLYQKFKQSFTFCNVIQGQRFAPAA